MARLGVQPAGDPRRVGSAPPLGINAGVIPPGEQSRALMELTPRLQSRIEGGEMRPEAGISQYLRFLEANPNAQGGQNPFWARMLRAARAGGRQAPPGVADPHFATLPEVQVGGEPSGGLRSTSSPVPQPGTEGPQVQIDVGGGGGGGGTIQLPGGGTLNLPPGGLTPEQGMVLGGVRAGNPVGGPYAQAILDQMVQSGMVTPGAGEIYGSSATDFQAPPPADGPQYGAVPPGMRQFAPGERIQSGQRYFNPFGGPGNAWGVGGQTSPAEAQQQVAQMHAGNRSRAEEQAQAFIDQHGRPLSRGWYARKGLPYPGDTPVATPPEPMPESPEPTGTQTPPINPVPKYPKPGQRRLPGQSPRPDNWPRSKPDGGGTQTPPINPGPTGSRPRPGGTANSPPINPDPPPPSFAQGPSYGADILGAQRRRKRKGAYNF